MIKLNSLLKENDASEEAAQKGFKSGGFGRWLDQNGVWVATTIDGKLVMRDKNAITDDPKGVKADQPDQQKVKPSTMTAKQAGHTDPGKFNINSPTPASDHSTVKSPDEKLGNSADEQQPNPQHQATMNTLSAIVQANQNGAKLRVSREKTRQELRARFEKSNVATLDTTKLALDEIVVGEDVEIVDPNDREQAKYFQLTRLSDDTTWMEENQEALASAQMQNRWRGTLPAEEERRLYLVGREWQVSPSFNRYPEKRKFMNDTINGICGKHKAKIKTAKPIYRGMKVSPDVARNLLSSIGIGREITFEQPSGFSYRESIALEFSSDVSYSEVGINMRISPNKSGEIHALHLHDIDSIPNGIYDDDGSYGAFEQELEVVKYKGPKVRITGVKKMVINEPVFASDKPNDLSDEAYVSPPRISYLIDMEELGDEYVAESILLEYESKTNDTFQEETNTPVNPSGVNIETVDKAHQMGLSYFGGGVWVDQQGKKVAKSVKGKLVKYDPSYDEPNNPADMPEKSKDETNYTEKKVGGPKGTNSGGFFEGSDGKIRYVKKYEDPTQAYSEHLTGQIYRDLGIGAPDTHVFKQDEQTMFASDIIQGAVNKNKGFDKNIANKILDGCAADILTANWDAVGLEDDNILIDAQGNPNRIDNGGSFLFRAQAGRKPKSLLNDIPEFTGFSDPLINPAYAKMMNAAGYKNITQMGQRFVDQVKKIAELYKKVGGWENYVQKNAGDMQDRDKSQVINMLNARMKLLMQKAVEMEKSQ